MFKVYQRGVTLNTDVFVKSYNVVFTKITLQCINKPIYMRSSNTKKSNTKKSNEKKLNEKKLKKLFNVTPHYGTHISII